MWKIILWSTKTSAEVCPLGCMAAGRGRGQNMVRLDSQFIASVYGRPCMGPCSQGLFVYACNLCACWALSLPARHSSQGSQSKHVFHDTCFGDEDIITVNSPVWNRILCYVCTCEMCLHCKRNVSCEFRTVHVISFYDNWNWYIIVVNVTGFYAIGVTEKRYLEWFLSQRRDVSCTSVASRLFSATRCHVFLLAHGGETVELHIFVLIFNSNVIAVFVLF